MILRWAIKSHLFQPIWVQITPDAIARLRLIHDSVQAGKMRAGRMTQAEFINYTAVHYAWAGINLAMRLYPAKAGI